MLQRGLYYKKLSLNSKSAAYKWEWLIMARIRCMQIMLLMKFLNIFLNLCQIEIGWYQNRLKWHHDFALTQFIFHDNFECMKSGHHLEKWHHGLTLSIRNFRRAKILLPSSQTAENCRDMFGPQIYNTCRVEARNKASGLGFWICLGYSLFMEGNLKDVQAKKNSYFHEKKCSWDAGKNDYSHSVWGHSNRGQFCQYN